VNPQALALIVAELRLLADGAIRHEYPYTAAKLGELADRLEAISESAS